MTHSCQESISVCLLWHPGPLHLLFWAPPSRSFVLSLSRLIGSFCLFTACVFCSLLASSPPRFGAPNCFCLVKCQQRLWHLCANYDEDIAVSPSEVAVINALVLPSVFLLVQSLPIATCFRAPTLPLAWCVPLTLPFQSLIPDEFNFRLL